MNDERRQFDIELSTRLGHLTGLVEGMQKTLDDHIKEEKEITKDVYTRLTKVDITLGKIGVAFTVSVFVVTFAVNLLGDYVKKWITN